MPEQSQTAQVEYIVANDQARQKFIALGWWTTLGHSVVPAQSLYCGEQRLDAEYYAADVVSARSTIAGSQFEIITVRQVTEPIYYPGRFKRIYAKDRSGGTAFLTASEMLHFRPASEEFLANNTAVGVCTVNPGWLLITRSGTVGRCVIVGNNLSRFAITDDAMRVRAKDVPIGYLYAFLATWMGQTLIAKDQYGSAIKHLEPQHLASVPLPLVPHNDQQFIHSEIMHAYALRDKANDLLDQADQMLHLELGLPRFDPGLVEYLPIPPRPENGLPTLPHPKAFAVRASELQNRLDGSYHVPTVRTVIETLNHGEYAPRRLRELAKEIYLPFRFKRIYVEKQYGVPFLRPSHLVQMRPYDLGYISRMTPSLDLLILKRGDVLISTDGTVGRISLVSSHIAGWAGSNNLARITYGNDDYSNGFLAAFLHSKYGYYQLIREIYGGVVDHLEVAQLDSVLVPEAPMELQTSVGKIIVDAYEMKDEATAIEEAAIQRLEALLQKRSTP